MSDCKKQTNLKNCNCTYPNCSRKGICCECLKYHLANQELPACFFPKDVEKTYNRSFKNFAKLVFDSRQKSDDFLFNLSQGRKIVIIDGGVNQKYPKAIRQGTDIILSCLNYVWFDKPIQDEFHKRVWKSLDKTTKTKLRYYKKLLNTNKLFLLPLGFKTTKDGNYAYYSNKLKGTEEEKNRKPYKV